MPLRDYICLDCGHEMLDELVMSIVDAPSECSHCESERIEQLPALIGGYNGDLGSASTKPKSTGSFKRVKRD